MKHTLYILTCFVLLSFSNDKETKLYKWSIRDWNVKYLINIPNKNLINTDYWNGTAKSIMFKYVDSSSIHIIIDPPTFDTLDRKFIYTENCIKRESHLMDSITLTRKEQIMDTIVYSGVLSNQRLWKEIQYNRIKVSYINVKSSHEKVYNEAIYSLKLK